MKNRVSCLLFFCCSLLISFFEANGQENNIKHKVILGETITQIALKYQVTSSDILLLNPSASNGLKENDIISIPKTKAAKALVVNSKLAVKEENPILHIVKAKETKFGLSKLYSVSISELERQNPQILNGLLIGHKLTIIAQNNPGLRHLVQPKETLYSISIKYGISVVNLIEVNNPSVQKVLQIGFLLNIPVNNKDNSTYYIVNKGDTKYGLSRRYGMTISALETLNPIISPTLLIGQRIKVRYSEDNRISPVDEIKWVEKSILKKETIVLPVLKPKLIEKPTLKESVKKVEIEKSESDNKGKWISYEILPKETLYSLSKRANLSTGQLIERNPQLAQGVQSGMIIQVPESAFMFTKTSPTPINKDNSIHKDLTTSVDKTIKKEIVFLLPFSLKQYDSNLVNLSSNGEDNFYKLSKDFFEGGLKAIDSIKTLGLDVSFRIVELKSNTEKSAIVSILKNKNIASSSVVFMPNYTNEIGVVSEFLNDKHVPIVSNIRTINENKFKNVLFSIPSDQFEIEKMLDYLNEKKGKIIVVSEINRTESQKIIKNKYPNITIIENLKNENIVKYLEKDKLNYVVIDSEKSSLIVSLTNDLLLQRSNYQIQLALLQSSIKLNFEEVSSNRLALFNPLYPSFLGNTFDLSSNQMYVSYFKNKPLLFHQGFDITFDILLRTFQKVSFEDTFKTDITQRTNLQFQYAKKPTGFSNQTFFVHQFK